MRRLGLVAIIGAALAVGIVHGQQRPAGRSADAVRLEAAIKIEVVDGNLKGAIEAYLKLVTSSDRAVAAQAQLHLGQCYEKLGAGQIDAARQAYESLVKNFDDQKDTVAQAQARLAALGGAKPGAVSLVHQSSMSRWGTFPRLSADGRFAVFPFWTSANTLNELLVRNLGSGEEHRIALPDLPPDTMINGGVLSPDNKQIAYATTNTKAFQGEIRIIGVNGSPSRLVISRKGLVAVPQWSGDGSRLFGVVASDDLGSLDVVAIAPDTGRLTRLGGVPKDAAAGELVMWPGLQISPDGRFVVVTRNASAAAAISLLELATGVESRLTDTGVNRTAIWWTPDGNGLVFAERRSGTPTLMFQPFSGGRPEGPSRSIGVAIGDLAEVTALRLTRDGTIYYWRMPTEAGRYVVSVDPAKGTANSDIPRVPGIGSACGHDWSPDGRSMVFGVRLDGAAPAATQGGSQAPCILLSIRTVAGGQERVLSPGLSALRRPRWSPDGKTILVAGSKDGVNGIYGVDAASGAATLVEPYPKGLPFGNNSIAADWSPDGKGIFIGRFLDGKYSIAYRDLASGTETPRVSVGNPSLVWLDVTSVARDGSVCLLMRNGDDSRSVLRLPAGSTEAESVLRTQPSAQIVGSTCTADGLSIWASQSRPTSQEPGVRALIRIPVAGGSPVDTGLSLPGLDSVRPSPDGTRVLVSAVEVLYQIWKAERIVSTK